MAEQKKTLGMKGPWDLTVEVIDKVVTKKSPGNYALGRVDANNVFILSYVGRSDDDLATRLKDHVGKHSKFMASYASSMEAAFRKECQNYHDFNPPENAIHPDRCEGQEWECHGCDIFAAKPPADAQKKPPKTGGNP